MHRICFTLHYKQTSYLHGIHCHNIYPAVSKSAISSNNLQKTYLLHPFSAESQCRGPIAQCLSNSCLDAVCEHYPDAKCVLSFCGSRSCQAVFYDENDKELDCSKEPKPKTTGKCKNVGLVLGAGGGFYS